MALQIPFLWIGAHGVDLFLDWRLARFGKELFICNSDTGALIKHLLLHRTYGVFLGHGAGLCNLVYLCSVVSEPMNCFKLIFTHTLCSSVRWLVVGPILSIMQEAEIPLATFLVRMQIRMSNDE